jgi:hypothetical protein
MCICTQPRVASVYVAKGHVTSTHARIRKRARGGCERWAVRASEGQNTPSGLFAHIGRTHKHATNFHSESSPIPRFKLANQANYSYSLSLFRAVSPTSKRVGVECHRAKCHKQKPKKKTKRLPDRKFRPLPLLGVQSFVEAIKLDIIMQVRFAFEQGLAGRGERDQFCPVLCRPCALPRPLTPTPRNHLDYRPSVPLSPLAA